MTVEDRLDRLERQNKLLKAGLVSLLAVVMVAGLFAFTQPEQIPDVVQARAFHVVGKDGTVLVKLEDTLGFGAGIAGTLRTFDSEGRELVSLGATVEGEGMVTTMNGKGQELVSLGVLKDGSGGVAAFDPSGIQAPGILVPR